MYALYQFDVLCCEHCSSDCTYYSSRACSGGARQDVCQIYAKDTGAVDDVYLMDALKAQKVLQIYALHTEAVDDVYLKDVATLQGMLQIYA